LCLFNGGGGCLSLLDLQQQSGLQLPSLKRVLHSLCSQQHKVLRKGTRDQLAAAGSSSSSSSLSASLSSSSSSTPPSVTALKSSDSTQDCFYTVNEAFRSRHLKCRLPMPSNDKKSRSTGPEGGDPGSSPLALSQQEVVVARKQTVEAAIVRLLKGRKTLSESQILSAVQSRAAQTFLPDLLLVRKCLAALVEKEYIEQGEDDPRQYVYCP
jgi:hypothetical protein